MNLRHLRLFFVALILSGAPAPAITLAEMAKTPPLSVRTVRRGEAPDLGKENQINNLNEGGNVLLLSSKELTSLDGIATLTVLFEGRPTPLAQVPQLHLFLNNNRIEALPDELGELDKVVFLYLNTNRIRTIPRTVTRMKGLQGMYFTANQLTEIPDYIFTMHGLRKFQISRNRVKVIPAEFGNLVNLIHLNLANNEIEHLPDTMANLTQLRVCDLSDNRLTALPEAFGRVQILYQLRVRNNPLTRLPLGFAAMPGTIDITGTKIRPEDLPEAIRAKLGTEKPAVKPKVIGKPAK